MYAGVYVYVTSGGKLQSKGRDIYFFANNENPKVCIYVIIMYLSLKYATDL